MKQIDEKDFLNDLSIINKQIDKSRLNAWIAVNGEMIKLFYQLGQMINEKGYSDEIIQRFAAVLEKRSRQCYSYDQLKKMSLFASTFDYDEIISIPFALITWGKYVEILERSSSKEEMLWYITNTLANQWSQETVTKKFDENAYQNRNSKSKRKG